MGEACKMDDRVDFVFAEHILESAFVTDVAFVDAAGVHVCGASGKAVVDDGIEMTEMVG